MRALLGDHWVAMIPSLMSSSAVNLPPDAPNLDVRHVARYFGVSVETLKLWRRRGRGPRSFKLEGKLIRYSLADLVEWKELQTREGRAS